jgi:hypothetical protein
MKAGQGNRIYLSNKAERKTSSFMSAMNILRRRLILFRVRFTARNCHQGNLPQDIQVLWGMVFTRPSGVLPEADV